jgi:hypothetical protein
LACETDTRKNANDHRKRSTSQEVTKKTRLFCFMVDFPSWKCNLSMNQMEQQKLIEQLKAEVLKAERDEKIDRAASIITPLIKAVILTIAVLFFFRLL